MNTITMNWTRLALVAVLIVVLAVASAKAITAAGAMAAECPGYWASEFLRLESLTVTNQNGAFVNLGTFDPEVTSYSGDVATTSDYVTVVAADCRWGISILPLDAQPSVSGHQVELSYGNNLIIVSASSKSANPGRRNYSVYINRPGSAAEGTARVVSIGGIGRAIEGETLPFLFTRTGNTTQALTVSYDVSESGGDMVSSSYEGRSDIEFPAGDASVKLDLETNSDTDWEEHSTVEISLADGASYDVGGDSVQINLRDNDFPEATAVLTVAPTTVEEGDEVTATIVVTTKAAQQPHGYGGSLKLKTALRTDSDAAQSQDFVMRAVNQGSFGLSRPSFRPVTADDGVVTAYESVYIAKVTIADDGIAEDAETFDIVMEKFLANKDALTLDANTTPTTVTIAAHEGATMSQRMIHMTVVTSDFGSAGTTFTITWEDEDEDAGCSAGYNVYLDRAHRVEDGENVYQGLVHLGSAASHETRIVRTFTSVQSGDSRFDVKLYCGTDSGTLISEVFIPSQGLASRERPKSGTYSTKLPLTALSVSPGTLSPAFHRHTTSYVVSDVPYENKRVTVNTVAEPGYFVNWGFSRNDADTGTAGRQVDLQVGENSFRLTVYKGTSRSYYDLTVKRTATPSRTGPDSLTVSGAIITDYVESNTSSIATYAVADQNASVTWSLSGDDAEQFSINDAGVLEFISSPDYENPLDTNGDNVYQVTIEASDGTDTGTLGITVTVTSGPTGEVEALSVSPGTLSPAFHRHTTSYVVSDVPYENKRVTVNTVVEPGYFVYWETFRPEYDADTDDADTATAGRQVDLQVGENSFRLSVYGWLASYPGTSQSYYDLTVKRTATPSRTGPDSLTVWGAIITDYVESSTSSIATYAVADQNASVTWSLSGDDAEQFSINDAGVLEFISSPDYENPSDTNGDNVYQVTIEASDGTDTGTLGTTVTVTSDPTGEVVAKPNTQATGVPIIDGIPRVGETLTADTSGIDDEDELTNVAFAYQWMRRDGSGDAAITAATGSTYTLVAADEGMSIKVKVSFTDDEGNPETLASDPTGAVALDPGPLTVFTVVDASTDPDTPLGALVDGGTLILGNPTGGEYGVRVNTDSSHDDHDDIQKVVLALSGAKTEGKTKWDPPYSLYGDSGEENLDGEDLPAGSYDLQATVYDDDGDVLGILTVSFAVEEYVPPVQEQQAVAANTQATGQPIISGTVQVGETLTAETSGIADEDGLTNVVFSYQWMADDTNIQDATGSSYTLTEDDKGKAITVRVSFTDDANNEESLTSEPTGPVVPDPGPLTVFKVVDASTNPDTVLRTLEDGDALKLANPASGSYGIRVDTDSGHDDHGDIDKVELDLTGAKTRNKEEGVPPYSLYGDEGEGNLTGENLPAGAYELKATAYKQDGDVLGTLKVSFTVTAGQPAQQPTVVPNTSATGVPTISGTAQVGETLTADTTGIPDADGLTNAVFIYQWMADDTAIQDATGSSYTLTGDDAGKAITVTVSFTDDANNVETLTSEPTGPVVPDPGPLTVFKVVDTSSNPNTVLGTLEDGGALPLANPASGSYGIRVDTDSGHDDHDDIHKVELALSGAKTEGKEEWVPPYSLYGDEGEGNLKGENLPAGAYELKATAYDDDGDALGTLKVSFTVTAGQPAQQPTVVPNTSATGVPTISGTAQVGETLTAETSGIADADGLTNVVFAYQWMADDTAIQDATGSSYTLTGDDAGKAITVTVSFTDAEGKPRDADQRSHRRGGGQAQHFCHRRAHHQRHGPGGPEAHGEHGGHRRCGRADHRFVQLPVAG